MSHFFAFFSRMKYINRWSLMRNTSAETLSQHSLEVAAIAHALALIGNRNFNKNLNAERAALLGMYHDMPEILTGDMPTPVKYYNNKMKSAYIEVEKAAGEKLLETLPQYLREDFSCVLIAKDKDTEIWSIVKVADKISALIKCIEERKAGNSEFIKAEQAIIKQIEKMKSDEAEVFIKEFLPSFELTLDQLT